MSAPSIIGPITHRLHPYLYTVGVTEESFCIIALGRLQCGQLLETVVEGELIIVLGDVICCLSTAICCLSIAICCLSTAICCLSTAICCLSTAICCLSTAIILSYVPTAADPAVSGRLAALPVG